MRSSARWIAVVVLVLAVCDAALPGWSPTLELSAAHALVEPWAALTFAFAANTPWDNLVAALVLAYFGPDVERQVGRGAFWLLYLMAALGGAGAALATPHVPGAGALAAAVAVLVVYAHFWPLNRVAILGFTALGAREVLLVLLGFRLLWGMRGGLAGIDTTPLGGLVVGLLWLWWLGYTSASSQFQRRLQAALVGDPSSWKDVEWEAIPREGLHPLTLEELDRVSAKARAQGMRALDDEERAFVHRLRQR